MLLYAAQDGRCFYCRCALDVDRLRHVPPASCASDDPTLDHVVPASKGGAAEYANLVLACRACNERKGDGPPPPGPHHPGA